MLNVLSLFDGGSTGKVALEDIGLKVNQDFNYYASEIDKNAIKCSEDNHPNEITRLGDVTKIRYENGILFYEDLNTKEAKQIDVGKIDLLIGGSPCFTSDALVLTLNGYKNIDKIKIGDIVLTHTGNWKKVINVGSKSSKITKVSLVTGIEINTTSNHPFYTKRDLNESPIWTEAKDLNPEIYNSFVVQQESVNNSFKTILSKSLQEQRYFLSSHFKILSYNKEVKIPFEKYDNALTLQQLILNCYNSYSPITKYKNDYILTISLENNVEYSDNCIWSQIVHEVNETEEEAIVYNLEVEEDNSYTVSNIVVHNCQSFSPMGKQEGFEGKSGLFYEYLRIYREIKEHNPDVNFFLENVRMRKDYKKNLDDYLETEGKFICSSLVSYQKRARIYWSNKNFTIPEDQNISFQTFKDTSENQAQYKMPVNKSTIAMWNNGAGRNNVEFGCANVTNSDKIYCLTTKQYRTPNSGIVQYEDWFRLLTREELEQAQNLPIGYTKSLSYNQAQAVLGNGWTMKIVSHILREILYGT